MKGRPMFIESLVNSLFDFAKNSELKTIVCLLALAIVFLAAAKFLDNLDKVAKTFKNKA